MSVNGFMDLPGWVNGLIVLPWWGYVFAALLMTHITIAAVTIYLHRHSAHRALELHPIVSHFFRAWLWLTTGMSTKATGAYLDAVPAQPGNPEPFRPLVDCLLAAQPLIQNRMDQGLFVDGFDKMQVETRLACTLPVGLLSPARHCHNFELLVQIPKPACRLEAIYAWHAKIQ